MSVDKLLTDVENEKYRPTSINLAIAKISTATANILNARILLSSFVNIKPNAASLYFKRYWYILIGK